MGPQPCAKYAYVVTPAGAKILPVPENDCKDEESPADYNIGGYLPVKVCDSFKNGRYKVVRKLGWGHFSTVWLVKDNQLNRHSALKVVKSAGRYAETARDEIKLLSQVAAARPHHPGREHIVSFLDSFSHKGIESSHICIVFEPLGENLLALIERNKKSGVPRSIVKIIAKQVLLGLEYLHDECDLVHTDIKPENILISIPDVESHIHSELSISPTASSKHVGIPPSNKVSRAGLSIPHQVPRRQVQIFESQPLSSPGRRSGSNSTSGSFVAQMQLSRLANSTSFKSTVQQVSKALASAQGLEPKVAQLTAESPSPADQSAPAAPTSPSTSSSCSSIASALNPGSSSVVSTPPTSISHSIGTAAAGLMAMSKQGIACDQSPELTPQKAAKSRLPLGTPFSKPKAEPSDGTMSSSWKDKIGLPSSWTDSISFGWKVDASKENNSPGPSSSKDKHKSNGSRRDSKGAPWKDPGTGSLAPAVVVSTSVSTSGDNNGGVVTIPTTDADTRSSSTINTKKGGGRSTPLPKGRSSPTKASPLGQASGISSRNGSGRSTSTQQAIDPSSSNPTHNQPSLLTQTAPTRISASLKRSHPRQSPPHHISQLSAHMHSENEATRNTCSANIQCPLTSTDRKPKSITTPPTSITPTPTLSIDPNTPPPTPSSRIGSPTIPSSSFAATPSSDHTGPSAPVPMSAPAGERLFEGIAQETVTEPPLYPITIKIADLGNATPSRKHYTEDIQTRQYRAPEAILGRKDWGTRADIWSVACVVFELLTADYLFDPQGQGELFTKDDDHMAQIIELVGDFPLEAKMGGKYSRELFDHSGALRYIRTLKPWPLKRVLMEKYSFNTADADELCSFLEPMLAPDMRDRKEARDMISHSWLTVPADEDFTQEW